MPNIDSFWISWELHIPKKLGQVAIRGHELRICSPDLIREPLILHSSVLPEVLKQSRRQRSTDEGATEVTKGGDDVAQSKNK